MANWINKQTLQAGWWLTKWIVEVNFWANTQEDHNASVTVLDSNITATSYPIVMPYAIETTDHDPDDYMVEGITATIWNIVAWVSFDIIASTQNHTFWKYKFIYHY